MPVKLLRIHVLADDYAGYEVRGLYAQHGLSLLLELYIDGVKRLILFDTGQDGYAVLHNAKLMKLDIGSVDAIVLSHSHYDHTGGVLDIVKQVEKKPIPIIAHPDIAKPAIHIAKNWIRDVGLPHSLDVLEKHGAKPLLLSQPLEIASGVVFLGEIPRYRPELTASITNLYTIENGKLVPHDIKDDTGLAIDVEGYGVVLISGCGHSGVVNMVIHAKRVLGKDVRAVVGGIHLASANRDTVERVLEALRSEGVEELYLGHCTGLRAEYLAMERYGDRFTKIYTGFVKTFSSRELES
ncbi:MAG TPA: MBL fold metallo-hydrolase [Ignisphaera aggregans]|uniref:MBL fold metallo-hydrolase n=1 Tax=Ignisphaera aggregans TaxID=334771 RepID=A0A832Z3S9_9CREN|nr:MBL fold metallo-hydrolase [Ignisphaera aggregans]